MAVILASVGVSFAILTLTGAVRDLATAGSLSSILALHIGVIVFVVARHLARRMRKARLLALRREDRRNKDHLAAIINLCASFVLGAGASGLSSPAAMSAMRHVAYHMATAKSLYGYLFTDAGKKAAEAVGNLALDSISGRSCALADAASMLAGLGRLEGELLDIDGDALVGRRMREAGAADPSTE